MTTTDDLQPTPPTAVCRRCGCESTLPALFQKTMGGRLCPSCATKAVIRNNQLIYGLGTMLILITIVGPWMLTGQPGRFGLALLGILVISTVLLILHELSHALAAYLLGGRVFGIHLGIGQLLWQRWIGNFYVGISLIPAAGMCFAAFRDKAHIRLRHGLMVFAGPFFHLLVLLILLADRRIGLGIPHARWVNSLFVMNAIMLAVNLWPFFKLQTSMGAAPSDGGQLLNLLRGKRSSAQIHLQYFIQTASFALRQKQNDAALAEVTAGLASYPESQLLGNLHGYLLMRNDRMAETLPIWQALAEAPPDAQADDNTTPPEIQPLMQALHYNNYAWVLIMLRRSADDVAVAADYIRRAFAMAPWIPAIRGTLAAVRIELGEYEAGIEEALAVADEYRREHSPVANENRGSTLATAALGCFRLGERENAAELLAEAQRLAPEDIAVRQAAAEINASPVL